MAAIATQLQLPFAAQRVKLLSKTRVLSGHRCVRKLWLEVHEPGAPELMGLQKAHAILWGNRVGERARTRFPGGLLIDGTAAERIARTRAALAGGAQILFEASFEHDGVHSSADILRTDGAAWVLTEVKSSTSVHAEYLLDAAVQTWVLRGAGIDVRRVELMVLNRACRFPNLDDLFVRHDVTKDVDHLVGDVPGIVRDVRVGVATSTLPAIEPGPQCAHPHPCPFTDRCRVALPAHHIGELYRLSAKKLAVLRGLGARTIADVPDDFELTSAADRQRRAVQSGQVVVEEGLADALARFQAPLAFLDFETVALPIPCWDGCRPYDQIPVQFSLDTQTPSGLRHTEWIADSAEDPRPAIAAALVEACDSTGTILAYNAAFERGCIDALIERVPQHAAALAQLRDRLEDLLPVVRDHVYHPEFHGSFGIKSVHPALTGVDAYAALEVKSGRKAMGDLERLMFERLDDAERERLRRTLLDYCATDTRAMVELHSKLGQLSRADDARATGS